MASITGDTELQSAVLEDLTDAVRYRHWLADLVRPYLGEHPLELGSGLGYYVEEWLADVARYTATEADEDRLKQLSMRFAEEPRVEVRELLLPNSEAGDHSSFVALNVLEHIPDHVAALRSAARLVRPGGHVVLVVPAFETAMSRFDRSIGHERRYTVRSLGDALRQAGLDVDRLHYINPVGLISWYVVCKILGQAPRNGVMLRTYDRFVVPVLRWLEEGRRPPFGQSVFAVARTPLQAPPG